MSAAILVPARFNGPRESGNGGYSAGLVAGLLGGVADVSLRAPVPLDRPLEAREGGDGALEVHDGETLVARGRAVPDFTVEVPEPVAPADARDATKRNPAPAEGPFSRCFVCGPERKDAFGVRAGEVEGRDLVASPWRPFEWTADERGEVRPEFVWAAMDCPTYFAQYREGELPLSFLASMTARVERPVRAGEDHVVMAWPLERDGRKAWAGAAVLDREGGVCARARALMIEARAG